MVFRRRSAEPDRDVDESPSKRRKLDHRTMPTQFSVYDHIPLPSWDDPEAMTAKLSKKIILDMNDPQLLLDIQQHGSHNLGCMRPVFRMPRGKACRTCEWQREVEVYLAQKLYFMPGGSEHP